MAAVFFCFMVFYSWKLTLVAIFVAAMMSISSLLFVSTLQQKTRAVLITSAENQGMLVETFKGALTLKTTNPYSDFGTLAGNVTAVSADTKSFQPEANSDYEIFIQPELKLSAGDRTTIRPGMEGRVDLISKEETVLKFSIQKAKLDRTLHY